MRFSFFALGLVTMFASAMVPPPYMLPTIFAGCLFACVADLALSNKDPE